MIKFDTSSALSARPSVIGGSFASGTRPVPGENYENPDTAKGLLAGYCEKSLDIPLAGMSAADRLAAVELLNEERQKEGLPGIVLTSE